MSFSSRLILILANFGVHVTVTRVGGNVGVNDPSSENPLPLHPDLFQRAEAILATSHTTQTLKMFSRPAAQFTMAFAARVVYPCLQYFRPITYPISAAYSRTRQPIIPMHRSSPERVIAHENSSPESHRARQDCKNGATSFLSLYGRQVT